MEETGAPRETTSPFISLTNYINTSNAHFKRVVNTKFDFYVFNWVDIWWTISPRGYHPPRGIILLIVNVSVLTLFILTPLDALFLG